VFVIVKQTYPSFIVGKQIFFHERLEEFKYLGTTLTYQNFIQEEIKSR